MIPVSRFPAVAAEVSPAARLALVRQVWASRPEVPQLQFPAMLVRSEAQRLIRLLASPARPVEVRCLAQQEFPAEPVSAAPALPLTPHRQAVRRPLIWVPVARDSQQILALQPDRAALQPQFPARVLLRIKALPMPARPGIQILQVREVQVA